MTDVTGFVADVGHRILQDLADRVGGPMTFRLVMQPVVAAIIAARAGLRDGRTGKPPYFWALFTSPDHRRELLRDGWKDAGTVFLLAAVIDVVYQIVVLRWIYPGEATTVAVLLAIVPYLLIRGPMSWIGSRSRGPDRKRTKARGAV